MKTFIILVLRTIISTAAFVFICYMDVRIRHLTGLGGDEGNDLIPFSIFFAFVAVLFFMAHLVLNLLQKILDQNFKPRLSQNLTAFMYSFVMTVVVAWFIYAPQTGENFMVVFGMMAMMVALPFLTSEFIVQILERRTKLFGLLG